jgi:hypothetical protein
VRSALRLHKGLRDFPAGRINREARQVLVQEQRVRQEPGLVDGATGVPTSSVEAIYFLVKK